MILIKFGGSVITNKEKPLSVRRKTIDNLSKSLKKIDETMIIVHGGGSYGHYWSVKYDMHTKEKKYDLRGVAIVKNSMIELNKIVLDSLLKNKLNPYCLPPTDNGFSLFVITEPPNFIRIMLFKIAYSIKKYPVL